MNKACAYRWGLRALLLAWMLAVVCEARAEIRQGYVAPVLAIVSPTAKGFDTEQEAAFAALSKAVEYSTQTEQAGGIIQSAADGLFYYTMPVTNKQAEHFAIALHFHGKLCAIYHTHPGNASAEFSNDDKQIAITLHLTSYIQCVRTGKIVRFDVLRQTALIITQGI